MSVAHRLGRILEKLTRQSGRLPDTPEYGSWLLGKSTESQAHRRIRIQVILTVFILAANILGIGAALMLVTVAFPVPSVFSDAPAWITWVVCPAYIAVALMIGSFWITRRTVNDLRWAIEERTPTREDELNTFLAPWRVAKAHLVRSCGVLERRSSPRCTDCRTRNSSRGSCSRSASQASLSRPRAI
jgi:adenylate cyclase